ncbi:alpha/beta hydrolase [Mucilaginibacter arboris]|uniref:Alpha/beta hydrolase fold domain-containing protein n=1 Tax=Mucilaginibacter arboris TaxID=2682090 RepID=A0A7K1SYP2_9SPHI|nr:alpha/beta hydrolase [Mucilaginibacter arboris]MVN22446.1 alpha/beta hydrolase fold domain-containing protein [Mucilaginibacter arboris]
MKSIKIIFLFLVAGWQAAAQTINKDVAYGNDPKQKMDVYLPENAKGKTPVIILIHGGSWIGGDKINMTHWLKPLQSGFPDYAIFDINYRLASRQNPANIWPAQIDDVDKAVAFIKDKAREYKINKKQLILLGESAGAQLALVEAFNHDPEHAVKVVVDLFGPTDMADLYTAHHDLAILMNGTPTAIPNVYADASVLGHVDKKSPATIIFHGTADPIVPIRESDSLNVKLKNANVPVNYITYPGKGHGWSGNEILDTYSKTVAFIKEQMK